MTSERSKHCQLRIARAQSGVFKLKVLLRYKKEPLKGVDVLLKLVYGAAGYNGICSVFVFLKTQNDTNKRCCKDNLIFLARFFFCCCCFKSSLHLKRKDRTINVVCKTRLKEDYQWIERLYFSASSGKSASSKVRSRAEASSADQVLCYMDPFNMNCGDTVILCRCVAPLFMFRDSQTPLVPEWQCFISSTASNSFSRCNGP